MYSYDLPLDVFGLGETRPSRPKKRSAKNSESGGLKRSFDISGVEVCASIDPLIKKAQNADTEEKRLASSQDKENYLPRYLGLLMMNINHW